jgi:hypothetical protein
MRDPVFTQTVQIGIVVRDLDAAMRKYVDDYGIGPWKIYEFNPGNAKDLREYGQPVKRSWRLAIAMVGQLQWELIEPLDNEGIYARFLAEKGGGVHHNQARHARLLHGHAVQRLRRFHGPLGVRDHDELRLARHLLQQPRQPPMLASSSGASTSSSTQNGLG